MKRIEVFIADDQKMFREGLAVLLNSESDIAIVGETFDSDVIADQLQHLSPDILLLDTTLVQAERSQFISFLRESFPEISIIMMASKVRDECVHRALNEGARGFIVKQAPSSEVVNAIRQVNYGHYYLSPAVLNRVVETYMEGTRTKPRGHDSKHDMYLGFNQLSSREKEVFYLLLEGLSSKEISQALTISPKTADKHRTSIYRKIGVNNSTQLLNYALSLNLAPVSQAI